MPSLVIDASVGCSAGGQDATYPSSVYCRDALTAILKSELKMVRTRDIWEEWKLHRSRFSTIWISSMIAKKRITFIEPPKNDSLREYPRNANLSDKKAEAFLKDCHLVEAAAASDNAVISLDEVVRALFRQASSNIGWLKTISWGNPSIPSELVMEWIENQIPPEEERQLRS